MSRSLRIAVMLAIVGLVSVGQALAASQIQLKDAATTIIRQVQDQENEELWRDLQTGDTPPKAAVDDGDEPAKRWESATNKTDCEKAPGLWDEPSKKCLEKK
jgi:hypothetical protein